MVCLPVARQHAYLDAHIPFTPLYRPVIACSPIGRLLHSYACSYFRAQLRRSTAKLPNKGNKTGYSSSGATAATHPPTLEEEDAGMTECADAGIKESPKQSNKAGEAGGKEGGGERDAPSDSGRSQSRSRGSSSGCCGGKVTHPVPGPAPRAHATGQSKSSPRSADSSVDSPHSSKSGRAGDQKGGGGGGEGLPDPGLRVQDPDTAARSAIRVHPQLEGDFEVDGWPRLDCSKTGADSILRDSVQPSADVHLDAIPSHLRIPSVTRPRMPWHDIVVAVGPPASTDVALHFIQRWNHHRWVKGQKKGYPPLMPRSDRTEWWRAGWVGHVNTNGLMDATILPSFRKLPHDDGLADGLNPYRLWLISSERQGSRSLSLLPSDATQGLSHDERAPLEPNMTSPAPTPMPGGSPADTPSPDDGSAQRGSGSEEGGQETQPDGGEGEGQGREEYGSGDSSGEDVDGSGGGSSGGDDQTSGQEEAASASDRQQTAKRGARGKSASQARGRRKGRRSRKADPQSRGEGYEPGQEGGKSATRTEGQRHQRSVCGREESSGSSKGKGAGKGQSKGENHEGRARHGEDDRGQGRVVNRAAANASARDDSRTDKEASGGGEAGRARGGGGGGGGDISCGQAASFPKLQDSGNVHDIAARDSIESTAPDVTHLPLMQLALVDDECPKNFLEEFGLQRLISQEVGGQADREEVGHLPCESTNYWSTGCAAGMADDGWLMRGIVWYGLWGMVWNGGYGVVWWV